MIVKKDRGTVKRMTFEILYPNGQLKRVVVENDSASDYGTFSAVILDEHGLENFLLKNEKALTMSASEIREAWKNVDKGEGAWPPAMVIVNTEGKVMPMCGGHKQLTPPSRIIC